MGKQHKKFDVHCDYCMEVTTEFGVFNEWQEHNADTVSLNVCVDCQIKESEDAVQRAKNRIAKKEFDEEQKERKKEWQDNKDRRIKEFMENEKRITESLDKRKGILYTIINKLRGSR